MIDMANEIRIDQVVMYDITELSRTTTVVPSDGGRLILYDTGEIAWLRVDSSSTFARGPRGVERPGVESWRTHASEIKVFQLTADDSARYRTGYSKEEHWRRYGTGRPTGPYPDLAIGLSFGGRAFAVEFTGRGRNGAEDDLLLELISIIAIPIILYKNRGRRDRAVAARQFWSTHLKV